VVDTCADVQHALGLVPIRIGAPEAVCVPEVFPSVPVDAFKCYAASGAPLGVELALVDQFQAQTVTVGAPALFCTPVSVDGNLLVHATRYLVCYETAPLGAAGGPVQVTNGLHANAIQVDVGAATGVCLPAVRQLVATCHLCGNGVIDGEEDCDDANQADGDGCSAVCRFERDCTCDGVPIPPPSGARCALPSDCTTTCVACANGGGTCGCQ
jgi:cysteine-rich repeat protein